MKNRYDVLFFDFDGVLADSVEVKTNAFAKMFEEMQMKYELSYIEPLRLAATWAMFLGMALMVLSLWPAIRGKVGLRFYPKAVRFIFIWMM